MTSELHVHDWTPWHPLAVIEGVQWRRRICPGCASTEDEPTPIGSVPESAMVAAAAADETCTHRIYGACRDCILAAAVPHIERAIRDRIADEITALAPYNCELRYDGREDPGMAAWVQGIGDAARVARGGEATA